MNCQYSTCEVGTSEKFGILSISERIVSENFLADCYSCQKLLTARRRLLSGPKPRKLRWKGCFDPLRAKEL